MKKFALIFNASIVLQSLENIESQLAFDYIEYTILLICFAAASILMMLIPVILFYSTIDNLISMNNCNNTVKKEICCEENNSKYLNSICNKYLKASTGFFKNFTALVAWNIFSLIYVVFGYDSFSNGLKEYFYFPLNVIKSLSKDENFDSIYEFQSNWIFMITLVILTFSFYFLGKYIGNNVAKGVIKKVELT